MIATMIISSTPQQKAFCIPVDLILHVLQTAIKTIVNADRLSTVISTGHFLTSVGFDLCFAMCSKERKEVDSFEKKHDQQHEVFSTDGEGGCRASHPKQCLGLLLQGKYFLS